MKGSGNVRLAFLVLTMSFCEGTTFALAAIHFESFASTEGLSLIGDATVSGQALRLTPAKGDQSGAVWFREKQPVASGFETVFQFRLLAQTSSRQVPQPAR